jgi:hypothetical protein
MRNSSPPTAPVAPTMATAGGERRRREAAGISASLIDMLVLLALSRRDERRK